MRRFFVRNYMRWSLKIVRVAGIGIYMHITFPLLLLWAGVNQFQERHSWQDAWIGVAFVSVLFVIVIMHELGHALTARRFGIPTRDITLLPIGGVARLERMPEKPKEELAVALAGPAINVCLALLLFAVITAGIQITELANLNFVGGRFLVNLMWANVFLAVFNMVPAFPMDGGRVLRALLATRLNYVLATRAAAYIGQGLAIVFAILGLIYRNPFWVFIAMFVYMGAAAEARQVELKSALKGVPVGRVMVRGIRNLAASSDLSTAAEELLQGWQDDFPVLEGNRVVGVLGRPDLLSALAKHGPGTRVSEVMDHEFVTATPMDPADVALLRLRSSDADMMLVMSDSELIGVVTRDSIRRFLSVASAHRRAPVRSQPQITSLTERPA